MSILLCAGATVEAVDKSGKIVEDTYRCTCHQVCAMGLAMWCSSMCNKGCNKVPCRAPLSRDKVRDKVPCGAWYIASFHCIPFNSAVSGGTRGILYSLLHPCSHIHPSVFIFSGDCSLMAPFGPCANT